MLSTSDYVFVLLINFTIFSKYVLTLDSSNGSVNKVNILTGESVNQGYDARGALNIPVGTSQTVNLDTILNLPKSALEASKSDSSHAQSEYALEGGGVPQQTATTLSNNGLKELEIGEEIHSKGSKGRKGVDQQGSSVVPRKGVDILKVLPLNKIDSLQETIRPSITSSQNKSSSNVAGTADKKNSTDQTIILPLEKLTEEITHAKKPEVVSDDGDVDDFDSYSIIKTSTTGEDYVIVGIAIVIGIWFSVFGALIFYRRAGEYWDRRHYRRMDFLVEGMYND